MLERLSARATVERLKVAVVPGDGEHPPEGPFDAVVERLLLWTLVDPEGALASWRRIAPGGRLLCFEGAWGRADRVEAVRSRGREILRRVRRLPPEHHDHYPASVQERIRFARGMGLSAITEAIERSGWRRARLERLRDVEWAKTLDLPIVDRLLGVTPEFVVVADAGDQQVRLPADHGP